MSRFFNQRLSKVLEVVRPAGAAGSNLPALDPVRETGKGGVGDVMKSVVQILALKKGMMGGMSSAWTGSGTIVHPQGIILTNCHVAHPRAIGIPGASADRMGISITESSDRAPALSYFAEVVAYEANLDLAGMRIVCDVKGQRVPRLNLPAVALGDSDLLE